MNAVVRIDVGHLVRYEAMCTAIAECHRIDEVKEIHDKARALEIYAKQAKNTDAERKACDIRLRAERRVGELLAELARGQSVSQAKSPGPGRGHKTMSRSGTKFSGAQKSEYAKAIEDAGISRQTAHRYQQLAAVPKETFEAALADPVNHPAASRIVRDARDPVPQIDDVALRVWGGARDFERHRDLSSRPADLMQKMTETMREDMQRLAPLLADYWNNFAEAVR